MAWNRYVIGLGALVLVATAGCAEAKTTGPAQAPAAEQSAGSSGGLAVPTWEQLSGRTFLSQEVTRAGEPVELAAGSTLQLAFGADGLLSASAGCNQMSGQASIEEGLLVLDGPMAMTMMACADPALDAQEQWYSKFLASEPSIGVIGAALELTKADETIKMRDKNSGIVPPSASGSAAESASPAASPSATAGSASKAASSNLPLAGTTWVLASTATGAAVKQVPKGVKSTLKIKGSKAQVLLACNTGRAEVKVSKTTIVFGPMATTSKKCTQAGATKLEALLVKALSGKTAYAITGSEMTLAKGKTTLTYKG